MISHTHDSAAPATTTMNTTKHLNMVKERRRMMMMGMKRRKSQDAFVVSRNTLVCHPLAESGSVAMALV